MHSRVEPRGGCCGGDKEGLGKYGCSLSGNIQGLLGQGSEQLDLPEGGPANKGVGLDDLYCSLPTQNIL